MKARDLTQRLYTQHTRCKQLLETLGLQIKSSSGSPLIRYGSEKSEYLEANDLDLLYWMESGDSDEEADKYSQYLGRIVIDLDAFSQIITTRVRDAEKYAKKWQKEARAYRDKSKRATADAENKIAYRQFKEGDLALFLPTNNGRPWAAFNVNAPHFFLRENEAHRLGGGRDWLLARISKVEERTVDLASHPSGAAAAGLAPRETHRHFATQGLDLVSVFDEEFLLHLDALAGRGGARLSRPHRCLGGRDQRDVHRRRRHGTGAGSSDAGWC